MYAAVKFNLYEQLMALPENLTGEIIDGQLHTHPRPSWPHALAASNLEIDIGGAYGRGRGGPGGWWIIIEPEIHFVLDAEVVVPDIAGWKRERMQTPPEGHKVEVAPDWVCEILSPTTASKDRELKMPLYARYGVQYAWLVDPLARTLEAYRLRDGRWEKLAGFMEDNQVSIAPFTEISITLSDLWR